MKKYTISVKVSEEGFIDVRQSKIVNEATYLEFLDKLGLKDKKLKAIPPPLEYETIKPIKLDQDELETYFTKDKNGYLDLELVKEWLEECDFCSWDDRTGEEDNAIPFRVLINNEWLFEFEVGQGECIEATWDHRIWGAEILNLKLIS